jgi:hypothetical protein
MARLKRVSAGLVGAALALTGTMVTAPAAEAGSYDLAGLWLFNERSGQYAHDLSFSGNTGRLGSTTGADANDPARIELPRLWFLQRGALRFDGNDFVRVPDAPSLEPDGVTVVARVRSDQAGNHRYVVAKGALDCFTASYGLYTGANGGLRFYVSDGSTYTLSADAGPQLWDGRWHTVVGAYDGSRVRLWVDGARVGEPVPSDAAIAYGLPTDDNFYIGNYAGPCTTTEPGFVGDVDGVALVGSYAGTAVGGLVD